MMYRKDPGHRLAVITFFEGILGYTLLCVMLCSLVELSNCWEILLKRLPHPRVVLENFLQSVEKDGFARAKGILESLLKEETT